MTYYHTGLDGDDATSPLDIVDDVQATDAVATEETLAAQQQAQAALAAQALLAQQQQMMMRRHVWQRLNGTSFRTRPGSWQDQKATRLAAMGRLVRVSGATMTGYAGELKYQVVNPHGAILRWREGEPIQNTKPIAYGSIVMGTPRGDGYIVEISSGGVNAWVNALDLNQITSADPSPVLASGEFAGADGQPGMMPATGCPQGQVWSDWYGKCVAVIPPPPPAPISSTQTSGEYVGDMFPATGCPSGTYWSDYYGKCVQNIPAPPPPAQMPDTFEQWKQQHQTSGEYVGDMFPATGCPSGTYWSDYYGKCVPNIPPPPPPMPDNFEQWKQQHQTSGDFAGYGWEVDAVGAPVASTSDVQEQAPQQQTQATTKAAPVQPHGQPSPDASAQHPAVAPNAPPDHHAAANAADANAHAQSAQAVASHPQAPGTGAEHHAKLSYDHATLATQHAHAAAQQPDRAHEHARSAALHAHYAKRHASHVRREGRERGWHRDFGEHNIGLFHGLFRNHLRHEHGFSRYFHAHPEWHGYGHPAWRGGVFPMWANHRAECAHRSGPHGLFGFIFGWNRRYCAIERIVHPMGLFSYRLTPAGLQEGVLLDDDMVEANNTFVTQTGQTPPDADAGPMPGSDDKASGALTPDESNDDDTSADDGDADADADADATATATTGWFAGWSEQGLALQAQDDGRARRRQQQQQGRGGNDSRRRDVNRGGAGRGGGGRHVLSQQERMLLDQQLGVGPYADQGMGDMGDMDMWGGEAQVVPTSMWGGPHAWHHHHHHDEEMPAMPVQQSHTTWLYGGGTTNPYDPNAQHPYGVVNG